MKLYKFKESKLGSNFARSKTKDLKNIIDHESSFCILSIPGVGVTNFLRYFVSTQKGYYFIFVDAFSLASLTKRDFFGQILRELNKPVPETEQSVLESCRIELERLAQKEKVVLVFNRFNLLQHLFDNQFFANLRWLQIVNRDQICMIATANRPLPHLSLFTTLYHFSPYSDEDLEKLQPGSSKENIQLSGGHAQLLQLLNKAEPGQAAYRDPFVRLQLKTILDSLTPSERKRILKTPFTPLLNDYHKSMKANKLSARELRIFNYLKQNRGEVVSKDKIFEAVWGDSWEEASDWALNSLIYRLRKNPLVSENYTIESHKKLGYMLK